MLARASRTTDHASLDKPSALSTHRC